MVLFGAFILLRVYLVLVTMFHHLHCWFYQGSCGSPETLPKTRQSKITPFLSQITSVRGLDSSQTETPKKEMVISWALVDNGDEET